MQRCLPGFSTSLSRLVQVVGAFAVSCVAGCANFDTVTKFAQATTAMSGTVRTELGDLDTLCRDQAELTIVVNAITNDGPIATCNSFRDAQARLAAVTLQVLDNYAGALTGLANDTSFDVSTDIESLGSQIQGLKTADGQSLVNETQVGAATKLASIIADAVSQHERKVAVQRLVAEKEDLKTCGRLVRSFFARDPSAPPSAPDPPYVTIVSLTSDALRSTDSTLGLPQFKAAEPIRTLELTRASATRRRDLQDRSGTGQDKPPATVVAVIDAWLVAVDTFAQDAFKPDPQQLLMQLQDVRKKALDARSAVRTLHH